jgi:hypothetical protein
MASITPDSLPRELASVAAVPLLTCTQATTAAHRDTRLFAVVAIRLREGLG